MNDTERQPVPSDDERYEEARKRVRKLREFYTTLAAYVVINLVLFLINVVTRSPSEGDNGWWFYWVTIFWGIGIVFYALSVFGERWGKDWERRKIAQYMDES